MRYNHIVKLEISNSSNDDENITWKGFEDAEDKFDWMVEQRKEEKEWNSGKIAGVMSTRYYSFREYDVDQIPDLTMDELAGMKCLLFYQILKQNLFK